MDMTSVAGATSIGNSTAGGASPAARTCSPIALREAKIDKITFELARLKRWKFGAKSEAMNAEQRRLFEETLAEDEAGLREQLERLRREAAAAAAGAATSDTTTKVPPRRPRRNPFPDHLRRVEHHHEPERTDCLEIPTNGRNDCRLDLRRYQASQAPDRAFRRAGQHDFERNLYPMA